MTKSTKIGIGGTHRNVTQPWIGVGGVWRRATPLVGSGAWRQALSTKPEIDPDIVAWFHADYGLDVTNGTWENLSSVGGNAVLGGVFSTPDPVKGLYFNGSDAMITVQNLTSFFGPTTSIELFFQPDEFLTGSTTTGTFFGSDLFERLIYVSGSVRIRSEVDETITNAANVFNSANEHQMVVVSRNATGNGRMYANGASLDSSHRDIHYTSYPDFYIGSVPSTSFMFKGWIKSIKIYNRELTSTEVSDSYSAGSILPPMP